MYTITFVLKVISMHAQAVRSQSFVFTFLALSLAALNLIPSLHAAEKPRLVEKDGRYALLVDGQP